MIIHPDYPELQGLAKITNNVASKLICVELCDGRGNFLAHSEFIRLATKNEIETLK